MLAAVSDPLILADLLSRTALGDRVAFHQLYLQTSAHLFPVALRILQQRSLAEEILQEAYLNVWHHAADYQISKSQPLTWLTSIVRNKALDQVRRAEHRVIHVLIDPDGDDNPALQVADTRPDPLHVLLENMESSRLQECLSTLDENNRRSVALAFTEGLTHPELAVRLNTPLGTVKAWVRRGLDKLKKCIEA
jgi:RNA polymerase sigma-70 factor (ECF subfamily)